MWSTLFSALVETRRRTLRPSASEMKVTLHQVRQEPALGLDVRVAHLVAHLRALGRQFAAPRHRAKSSSIPASASAHRAAPRGSKIMSIFRNRGRIGAERPSVKVFRPAEALAEMAGFAGGSSRLSVMPRAQSQPSYKRRIPRRKRRCRGIAADGIAVCSDARRANYALFAGYFCLNDNRLAPIREDRPSVTRTARFRPFRPHRCGCGLAACAPCVAAVAGAAGGVGARPARCAL